MDPGAQIMSLFFALLFSVCWPHFVDIFVHLTKGDGSARLLWLLGHFKFDHINI